MAQLRRPSWGPGGELLLPLAKFLPSFAEMLLRRPVTPPFAADIQAVLVGKRKAEQPLINSGFPVVIRSEK